MSPEQNWANLTASEQTTIDQLKASGGREFSISMNLETGSRTLSWFSSDGAPCFKSLDLKRTAK